MNTEEKMNNAIRMYETSSNHGDPITKEMIGSMKAAWRRGHDPAVEIIARMIVARTK